MQRAIHRVYLVQLQPQSVRTARAAAIPYMGPDIAELGVVPRAPDDLVRRVERGCCLHGGRGQLARPSRSGPAKHQIRRIARFGDLHVELKAEPGRGKLDESTDVGCSVAQRACERTRYLRTGAQVDLRVGDPAVQIRERRAHPVADIQLSVGRPAPSVSSDATPAVPRAAFGGTPVHGAGIQVAVRHARRSHESAHALSYTPLSYKQWK